MQNIQSKQNSHTRDCRVSSRLSGFCFSAILLGVLSSGFGLVGCTTDDHKQNADEVREKTAEATAELKRNAKSVAEGVKEGWSRDKQRVDLNTASRNWSEPASLALKVTA